MKDTVSIRKKRINVLRYLHPYFKDVSVVGTLRAFCDVLLFLPAYEEEIGKDKMGLFNYIQQQMICDMTAINKASQDKSNSFLNGVPADKRQGAIYNLVVCHKRLLHLISEMYRWIEDPVNYEIDEKALREEMSYFQKLQNGVEIARMI
jgi:hypothetical protein